METSEWRFWVKSIKNHLFTKKCRKRSFKASYEMRWDIWKSFATFLVSFLETFLNPPRYFLSSLSWWWYFFPLLRDSKLFPFHFFIIHPSKSFFLSFLAFLFSRGGLETLSIGFGILHIFSFSVQTTKKAISAFFSDVEIN